MVQALQLLHAHVPAHRHATQEGDPRVARHATELVDHVLGGADKGRSECEEGSTGSSWIRRCSDPWFTRVCAAALGRARLRRKHRESELGPTWMAP